MIQASSINPFDEICKVYYDSNGGMKVPTQNDIDRININLENVKVVGSAMMGGGVVLTLFSLCIIQSIPYVGSLLSFVGSAAGISSLIIGRDTHTISQNLQSFTQKKASNITNNFVNSMIPSSKNSEAHFRKKVIEESIKDTLVAKHILPSILND